MSNFLKDHISGMVGVIYVKSGMYVVSSDMQTPAQQIWSCSDKR